MARVSPRQRGMAKELWRAIPVVMRDKGRRERDGYIAHHHAELRAVTNIVENVPKWWIDGAAERGGASRGGGRSKNEALERGKQARQGLGVHFKD